MEIGGMPLPIGGGIQTGSNSNQSVTLGSGEVYDKSIDTSNLRPTIPMGDRALQSSTNATGLNSNMANQIVHLRSQDWDQGRTLGIDAANSLRGFKAIAPGLYKNDEGVLAKWSGTAFAFRGFEA